MPKRPDIEDVKEFVELNKKPAKKTTSKETWKLFERNVAKDFGTTRTPLSGMVKTITNSDTLHPKIYIECKLRGGDNDFTFWKIFESKTTGNRIEVMEVYNGDDKLWLFFKQDFFKLMECKELDLKAINIVVVSKVYKSLLSLYLQTTERAEIEEKIPVMAVKKKNKKSYMIGTSPSNLVVLHKILNKK